MPGNIYAGLPAAVILVLAVVSHQPALALLTIVIVAVAALLWDFVRGTSENRLQRVGMTLAALLYSGTPTSLHHSHSRPAGWPAVDVSHFRPYLGNRHICLFGRQNVGANICWLPVFRPRKQSKEQSLG